MSVQVFKCDFARISFKEGGRKGLIGRFKDNFWGACLVLTLCWISYMGGQAEHAYKAGILTFTQEQN